MSKNIKHLIKIYDEYKKIKGYSDGEVVQSNDSNFPELKKRFQKAFSTPTPTPSPEDSQEDKYEKIRKQNRTNFGYDDGGLVAPKEVVNALRTSTGGKPLDEDAQPDSTPEPQYTPTEEVKRKAIRESYGYSKGGLISDDTASNYLKNDQPQDNSNKNSPTAIPQPDKLKTLAGAYGFSQGGKVEKPHNKANLHKLKESFDSFLKEEGYYDGGPVQGYDEGGQVGMGDVKKAERDQDDYHKKIYPDFQPDKAKTKEYINYLREQGFGVQHLADGGQVDPMAGNVSPEQYAANLEALKQQGLKTSPVEGNDQLINSDLNKHDQSIDTKSAEDKLIEEPYADEELAAKVKEEEPEESDDDSNDEDSEDEEDSSEPETTMAPKQESKPEPKKEEPTKPTSTENPEQLQYTPSQNQPNALETAQKQRDMNIAMQGFAKGAALFGAGASKTNPDRMLGIIGENDKYVGLPVQKYQEQIENEKNDPNSNYSKQYALAASQLLGIDPKKLQGMAATTLDKVVPLGVRQKSNEFAVQKLLTTEVGKNKRAEEKNKNQSNIAEANRKNQLTKQELANKGHEVAAKTRQEGQVDQQQSRALTQTQQLLESARGNPAAAQAEKDLYASQKANSLYNMYKDPNQANNSMFQLYATEIAKMANGGQPSIHELQGLNPTTIPSYLSSAAEKFSSTPTPANKGAFMKQFKKYSDALATDAQRVIKDKYSRVIEPRKKQLGNANYNALQDQYVNRFKSETESPPVDADLSKMSPEQLKAYIQAHGG